MNGKKRKGNGKNHYQLYVIQELVTPIIDATIILEPTMKLIYMMQIKDTHLVKNVTRQEFLVFQSSHYQNQTLELKNLIFLYITTYLLLLS